MYAIVFSLKIIELSILLILLHKNIDIMYRGVFGEIETLIVLVLRSNTPGRGEEGFIGRGGSVRWKIEINAP